ncbi:RidA superfamily protein [Pseudomonas sp. R1-43-08]|uniref:RidA family protein n=1 Tax=Pseudomonas sp. R1-43-08 TaxID=1173270 RepID=UPI000F55D451|nr:RidA family protein [Pseudomonas sp. R1-43-08]AZF43353.1 RidA superfamily protein [Pseudomonas sp. R1-43-08]
MTVLGKLKQMGLTLPEKPAARGNYEPVVIHEGLAYVSGQVCRIGDRVITGPITCDTPGELVIEAGKTCVLRALSLLDEKVGLQNISQILFVRAFIYGAPGYNDYSAAADGASRLLIDLFDVKGRHARSAIGVAGLPGAGMLELEIIAAVACADSKN